MRVSHGLHDRSLREVQHELAGLIAREFTRLRFAIADHHRACRRGNPKPVQRLSRRSTAAPIARPTTTSLVQCASRTIRVRTRPAPIDQTRLRFAGGSTVAADASAPTWMAWPDGKAS